mmetsp:Transcript_146822/g.381567  ORF Transcript_146822/g.381567 Transcript_146822/m.381567 type:complete len:238 (+) Transcript_146822:417-1130(+)
MEVPRLVTVDVREHAVVRVRSADVRRARLGRGRVVGNSEVQGLVALRGRRDRVHIGQAQRCLDDHAEPDALLSPDRPLRLRGQHVHRVDVRGIADHGQDEHVQALPRLLDELRDVLVLEDAVASVDPDSDGLFAEVHLLQRLDDVFPRRFLLRGRNGILQVHDDDVGSRFRSLRDEFRLRARHVELRPIQTVRGRHQAVVRVTRPNGPGARPSNASGTRGRGSWAKEGGGDGPAEHL